MEQKNTDGKTDEARSCGAAGYARSVEAARLYASGSDESAEVICAIEPRRFIGEPMIDCAARLLAGEVARLRGLCECIAAQPAMAPRFLMLEQVHNDKLTNEPASVTKTKKGN